MALITLEDNINHVYTAAGKKAERYTPLLFTPSLKREGSIQPVASGILFSSDGHYFLITAGHCLKNQRTGKMIRVGVLDGNESFHLIEGGCFVVPGVHCEIDIGIIRMSSKSAEVCRRNFDFLDDTKRLINQGITDNQAYLVFGHPASKISVDHRRRNESFP